MKNKNDITEIEMRDVKVPVFKIGDVVWAIAQDTEEIIMPTCVSTKINVLELKWKHSLPVTL